MLHILRGSFHHITINQEDYVYTCVYTYIHTQTLNSDNIPECLFVLKQTVVYQNKETTKLLFHSFVLI